MECRPRSCEEFGEGGLVGSESPAVARDKALSCTFSWTWLHQGSSDH